MSSNRIEQMITVQQEGLELFKRKNADYGDAFAQYGVIGVLMRIEDKIKRSMNITKNGIQLVNDESIRDTLIDLHNYAAMGIMLMDEKEPKYSYNVSAINDIDQSFPCKFTVFPLSSTNCNLILKIFTGPK